MIAHHNFIFGTCFHTSQALISKATSLEKSNQQVSDFTVYYKTNYIPQDDGDMEEELLKIKVNVISKFHHGKVIAKLIKTTR